MLTKEQAAQQQAEITRRRQMAEVLTQQSMAQPQNLQTYGPMQAIGQILSGVMANKKIQGIKADEESLINKQAQGQKDEMARIIQAYQGKPAQESVPFQDEAGAAFTPEDTKDFQGFQSQPNGLLAQEAAPVVEGGQKQMIAAMLASPSADYQKMAMEMMAKEKPSQWKLGEIGAQDDKRQSIFYNEADPTQTKLAGEPIRKNQAPDWMMPGYVETKRKVAEVEREQKPMPTQALKMQQAELDAIGVASGVQADLGAIEKQIESGKLNFGPIANLVNKGRNLAGVSTEESRNFSTFKSSLEKLRNDSLRLNTGVQTDGDSQRAWNELFENINDKGVVTQRLAEIKKLNERAVKLRQMNVDGIRSNYNRDPLDTSGYTDQDAAIGAGKLSAAEAKELEQLRKELKGK